MSAPESGRFELLYARARAQQEAGDNRGAVSSYLQCLSLNANAPEVYNNLGTVLDGSGLFVEAIEAFQRALALNPDYVRALNNLGKALRQVGQPAAACATLERALALSADNPLTLTNLGFVLLDLDRPEEALVRLRAAAIGAPELAEAHQGLGQALLLSGDPNGALGQARRAVALKPGLAPAHVLAGRALLQRGLPEEAWGCFERAIDLSPSAQCLSEVLDSQVRVCDWAGARRVLERLRDGTAAIENINTFVLFSVSDDPEQHLRSARGQAQLIMGTAAPMPDPPRYAHERLRIAYLSGDYHEHATMSLIPELFELHDRASFEIFAVSFGPAADTPGRRRIASACGRFVDVRGLTDRQIAGWLRDQEIDIAVDLKGYTAQARSVVLGYRPAPIQVNYLGYPGTMGAPFIDYIVADEFLVPAADRRFYQEKIVYLPDSYQVNDRGRAPAAATGSRAAMGLPDDGFVFCCFNGNWKISEPVFDAWMRLLAQVPGSVLWLLADSPAAAANLRRETARRGVAPERLVFCTRTSTQEHLARHALADLFLDTLPVNAHTTASDALWMGLPLVTCAGRAFPGRVAGSLLRAIGLPELVTPTLAEYERLALQLASQPARLRELRARLRLNRLSRPLFDTPAVCRHLESAYRQMWRRYAHGEAPETFAVGATLK